MGVKVYDLPYKIIAVVQNNIRHLLDHPKQLSWCLMCYDLMHKAVRLTTGSHSGNPKYIFLDNPEKDWPGLTQYELDLLYEAWGVTVSNDIPLDYCGEVVPKPNMTLDEWIAIKTNPDYIYNSLYGNDIGYIVEYLLCVCGSGVTWNKDGYLSDGRDGIDNAIFYGYSQAENQVDPKIRRKIKKICNDRRIRLWFDDLYQTAVEYNQLSGKQKSKFRSHVLYNGEERYKTRGLLLKAVRDAKQDIFPKPCFSTELDRFDQIFAKYKGLPQSQVEKTEQQIAKEEGRFFYPFSKNYSNIGTLPDNAHSSYVKAAIKIARMVVSGKAVTYGEGSKTRPATGEMISTSKKLIETWEPRGY